MEKSTRTHWKTVGILILLAVFAVLLREHKYVATLKDANAAFWLESAMRFRELRFIAEGIPLPNPDRRIQWPDGYIPYRDTLVQEYLLGGSARLLEPERLAPFIRHVTRIFFALMVFPLFWLARLIVNKDWAALYAVALIMVIPALVDRSTGGVIYRENVMLPLLAVHVAAVVAHFRRSRGYAYAWLAGATLLLCHLTWKVTTFYHLYVLGFCALLLLWRRPSARDRGLIAALLAPPLIVSILIPLNLHYDRFWASSEGALSMAILGILALSAIRPNHLESRAARGAMLIALTGALVAILPGGVSYTHAWDTLLARLRYLDTKPDDPALLSIHARHYWTGNYRAPTPARALRDFIFPTLIIAFSAYRLKSIRSWIPRKDADFGTAYALLALAGSLVGYLVFRKFATFVALLLTPLLAIGSADVLTRAKHRRKLAIVILGLCLSLSSAAGWTGIGGEQLIGDESNPGTHPGVVFSQASYSDLVRWLDQSLGRDDVILASWVISPHIAAYIDRPVILNSFFESEMVDRFVAFNQALFESPEEFRAFCRRYEADYLIVEAHFLMRTDKWMSYRYVANHLRLDGNEALFALHYSSAPEGFEVVYQNDYFRVLKVLSGAHARTSHPRKEIHYAPLFDRELVSGPAKRATIGPDLLYGMIKAERWIAMGRASEAAGDIDAALNAYRTALQKSPASLKAYQALHDLLLAQGKEAAAEKVRALAEAYFGGRAPSLMQKDRNRMPKG